MPSTSPWTIERLNELVTEGTPESRTLDFKRQLPDFKDQNAKRDFLIDVMAFANTIGGTIIYGIEEEPGEGTAKKLCGCRIEKSDALIRRISSIIRSGLEPTLSSFEILEPIAINEHESVLVITIKESLASPHALLEGASRIYRRGLKANEQMDIFDIKESLLQSLDSTHRMKQFRAARLSAIQSSANLISLVSIPKLCVHVMPALSFRKSTAIHAHEMSPQQRAAFELIQPHLQSLPAYFLEGYANVAQTSFKSISAPTDAYTLVFRNGCIESIDASVHSSIADQSLIRDHLIAELLSNFIPRILEAYKSLDMFGPFHLGLSILDAADAKLYSQHIGVATGRPLRGDNIILPEIEIVETPSEDHQMLPLLRPMMDMIYNAFGLERCIHYDPYGDWRPRIR